MSALLALLALGVRGWSDRTGVRFGSFAGARSAYAFAIALAGTFLARTYALGTAVQGTRAPLMTASMPLSVYSWNATAIRMQLTNADVTFSIAEMLALAGLVATIARLPRRAAALLTVCCAAAMLAGALGSGWLSSPDLYLYAGQATLGLHAYAPPPEPFPGDLAIVNRLWGAPLLPSAYGPLFLMVASLAIAPFSGIAAKLFALRLLGAASFVVCACIVRKLGVGRAVVVALACNPALIDVFVQNAHNDLLGVDFMLAAMLAARRRRRVLAIVLAAAAALVKVTLLLPAMLAFVAVPATRRRLIDALMCVAIAAAGYAAFAGPAYTVALEYVARSYPAPYSPPERVGRWLATIAACAAVALALTRKRVFARAAWTFASVGPFMLPWYLVWGLPWALEATGVALAFLVTMPVAVLICDPGRPPTPLYDVAVGSLFVALLGGVAANYVAARRSSLTNSAKRAS